MFKNKEYVLAVVREGGFSKAAERLYVSQPSLSATIKRIEDKLSSPIFDRTTIPITLTELGREYVRCAIDIEQREKDFELYSNRRATLTAGEVKVGASSLFSSFALPSMIERFNKEYPSVIIRIFENNTKNLLRELTDGELDIVIDNAVIKDDSISSMLYSSETILLAVPDSMLTREDIIPFAFSAQQIKEGCHLSEDRTIELNDVCELPFILLNSENDTGKRAVNLFKKHGISPKVVFKLDQQITSYNICNSGMGVCFVSDILVKNAPASESVRFFKLSDPEISRNVYIYQKKNRYSSLACRKFVEYNMKKEN